ncbi:hypothetical protein ACIRJO_18580 [Streptomyces sp. NPDC102394]
MARGGGTRSRSAGRTELTASAVDLAARRAWYRHTVVLDALEHLHRHR